MFTEIFWNFLLRNYAKFFYLIEFCAVGILVCHLNFPHIHLDYKTFSFTMPDECTFTQESYIYIGMAISKHPEVRENHPQPKHFRGAQFLEHKKTPAFHKSVPNHCTPHVSIGNIIAPARSIYIIVYKATLFYFSMFDLNSDTTISFLPELLCP